MTNSKIALDVDGVLADFNLGVLRAANKMGLGKHFPPSTDKITTWAISPRFSEVWAMVQGDPNFWLGLEPIVHPDRVRFVPAAYITHRPVSSEVTRRWIRQVGFPDAPIYTVNTSKTHAMREVGARYLVDDKEENFLDVNARPDLTCLLIDRPYNRDVVAPFLRVYSIEEARRVSEGLEAVAKEPQALQVALG